MPRLAWLLALALLAAAPARARVVVVGLDGASWSVIDPLLRAGELPHLAALLARGAGADLETVEPVVSPVVWTSVATGRGPEAHGVAGFLATRFTLETPTVFERLAAAGVRVGLYEWLVTWPPPALPGGFVIPGWMKRDESVWPSDVWRRAGVPPCRVDYDSAQTREGQARNVRDEVARKPGAWVALDRAFRPEVGALTLYALDRASHRFWREAYPDGADPADPAPAPGSLLREAMVGVDRGLGAIAASLGPEDVVLVASDHGFQAGDPRSVWVGRTRAHLARAGLDPERDAFTVVREWGMVLARVHPGPFAARDAVLTRIESLYQSARGPDGEALYNVIVFDGIERPPGHRRPLLARARQWVYRRIADWVFGARFEDPAHGWVVAVPERDTLEDLWPDATVTFDGASLPIRELVERESFDGDHHPTAVFVAAGGPIRHRAGRGALSVLQIAPLVAYLAGHPIPDDLEGALPEDWIDPGWLAAHPPRSIAAADLPRLAPSESAPTPAVGDVEMLERLRSLGYVE